MSTEYQLSYTAAEIDGKLGMIDELSENVEIHSTSSNAHADIREQISKLSDEIVDEIAIMTQELYNSMTQSQLATLYANGVRLIAIETSDSSSDSGQETPTYINLVPTSIDTDGSIFNGTGWKGRTRLNSSGAEVSNTYYASVTGYIPASSESVVHIKGIDWDNPGSCYVCSYDKDFGFIAAVNSDGAFGGGTVAKNGEVSEVTLLSNSNIAWIRVSSIHDVEDTGYFTVSDPLDGPGSYLIVTVDEGNSGTTAYTNQVLISIDENGNVYNTIGYKDNYRLNSSGAEATAENRRITGFIPCVAGDVIRFRYSNNIAIWTDNTSQRTAFNFYNSQKGHLGQFVDDSSHYGIFQGSGESNKVAKVGDAWEYTITNNSDIAFVRLTVPMSFNSVYGSILIVTINEEIMEV